MFALVFGCFLIFHHQASGSYLFPASWRHSTTPPSIINTTHNHNTPEGKMYFENFNFKKLNPVYWFYDSTEDDKIDELFKLIRCLIEEKKEMCHERLQITRKMFEKKKKGEKPEKNQEENSPLSDKNSSVPSKKKPGNWKSTTEKPSLEDKSIQSDPEKEQKSLITTSPPSDKEESSTTAATV